MKSRFKWDKKYFQWGLTAFCVIGTAVLLNTLVGNIARVNGAISNVTRVLAPFGWGLVIAYLLSPLMRTLEQRIFLPLFRRLRRKNSKNDGSKFARVMSVLFSEIILVLVLVALVNLIIPQMLSSIQTIISNSSTYADNLSKWLEKLQADHPELEKYLGSYFDSFNNGIDSFLETQILPRLGKMVSSVTSGVYGVAKSVYNLIIGIIVSIYLLSDKEGYLAAIKRASYAIFPVETAEQLRVGLSFVDKTFIGFLNGKLLDSLIIGLLCYIACSVMLMPYALLVSVIIGATNIIPFFGPFIGAIPSALIILMVDPVKCLVFVVFILILQQIDGNIIGPRILGNSIGITGLWVMFAIILGGGLFGFWGLLLGVPVFVVIYTVATNAIIRTLRKKGFPADIEVYKELERIDPESLQIVKKTDAPPVSAAGKNTPPSVPPGK